jgi:hypothetical protein
VERIWWPIAAEQEGIVARRQLLAAGLTPGVARREVVARRWRALYPGIYATFTGAVPDRAQVWAATLRAGTDAVAAGRTALWLAGVLDQRPPLIEVAIPHERRNTATPVDGQIVRLATTQTVTALTLNANAGQTISGAVATLTAAAPATYMYNLSGTKWYHIQ